MNGIAVEVEQKSDTGTETTEKGETEQKNRRHKKTINTQTKQQKHGSEAGVCGSSEACQRAGANFARQMGRETGTTSPSKKGPGAANQRKNSNATLPRHREDNTTRNAHYHNQQGGNTSTWENLLGAQQRKRKETNGSELQEDEQGGDQSPRTTPSLAASYSA
jgi:hypothetical protein